MFTCETILTIMFCSTRDDVNHPCLSIKCPWYEVCKAYGPLEAKCECDEPCPLYEAQVCGSDGVTYKSWPCVGSTRTSPSLIMGVTSVSAYTSIVEKCARGEGDTTYAFNFIVVRRYGGR